MLEARVSCSQVVCSREQVHGAVHGLLGRALVSLRQTWRELATPDSAGPAQVPQLAHNKVVPARRCVVCKHCPLEEVRRAARDRQSVPAAGLPGALSALPLL